MNQMTQPPNLVAIDLGNASGRVYLGGFANDRLAAEEIHRFENGPSRLGKRWHWDPLRLYADVIEGLRRV